MSLAKFFLSQSNLKVLSYIPYLHYNLKTTSDIKLNICSWSRKHFEKFNQKFVIQHRENTILQQHYLRQLKIYLYISLFLFHICFLWSIRTVCVWRSEKLIKPIIWLKKKNIKSWWKEDQKLTKRTNHVKML